MDAKPGNFSQAYAALIADASPRRRSEIGCIAAQQKIAPAFTSPASGSPVTDAPPAFTWAPNGGGPAYRSNSFVVQVCDAAFTTLIATSARLSAPKFTPAPALRNQIRAGRGALNVVVRATQTAPPATGPYDSCALRLGS